VKDKSGFAVAYVYEEEPGRQAAANLMTKDEARRIAVNIAKLPALVQREVTTLAHEKAPQKCAGLRRENHWGLGG
jgi:hypothetical protein